MAKYFFYIPLIVFFGYLFNPSEKIEKELNEARELFEKETQKSYERLLKLTEEKIKQIAKQGNLDLVLKLTEERKNLETDKVFLPIAIEFKSLVTEYNSANQKSKDKYKIALTKAIKEYTKILDVDKASAIKLELDELKESIPKKETKGSEKKQPEKKQAFSIYGLKTIRFKNGPFFCADEARDRILCLRIKEDSPKFDNQFGFNVIIGLAEKKGVSFASPNLPNHFLVLLKDTVWRIEMRPLRNNADFYKRATFYLRSTAEKDEFLIESFDELGQFLIPGDSDIVRFKRETAGDENFKQFATVKIEPVLGKK